MATITTWKIDGWKGSYLEIRRALESEGLETKMARALLPRYAFARAVHGMRDEKVIDIVREDEDVIVFQFNAKEKGDDGISYPYEAQLSLDKEKGTVVCLPGAGGDVTVSGKELAWKVGELVEEKIGERTAKDITRIIHRVAEEAGVRLQPIRKGSGTFLVTSDPDDVLDRIDRFVFALLPTAERIRFRVNEDDAATRESISAAVTDDLTELVSQYEAKIGDLLDPERKAKAREKTMKTAVDEIAAIKLQLESYGQYLADRRQELLDRMEAARRRVQEKLASGGAASSAA